MFNVLNVQASTKGSDDKEDNFFGSEKHKK
jgi:hypothetical protein